jgi:pSer/pThr/pTyr-binding forkhead associated (FHA) protein
MLEPLALYRRKASELSPEAFRAFCPEPLLVFDPFDLTDDTGFRTMQVNADQARSVGFLVARVRKRREANAFLLMITLGRAPNNDIELRANGVSKFHAYLRAEKGGFTLTDSGSSFGTRVQGRTLQPRVERTPLDTGDEVRLGDGVRAVFVGAADAQRYLTALRPSGRFTRQA